MSGRLMSRDGRSLKERLKDFAGGSDNFSRMGPRKKVKKKKKAKK